MLQMLVFPFLTGQRDVSWEGFWSKGGLQLAVGDGLACPTQACFPNASASNNRWLEVELGMLVGASAGGDLGGVLMNLTTECSCMRVGAGDGSLQLEAEGRVCVDCVHWRLNTGSVNTELAFHAVGKRRRGSYIKTGVRSNTQ